MSQGTTERFHQRSIEKAHELGLVHLCAVGSNSYVSTFAALDWLKEQYPESRYTVIAPNYKTWAFDSVEVMVAFKMRWG